MRGKRPDNDNTAASEGKEEGDDGGEAGREVRSVLLDWYGKHYSANRMTLAIYGKGARPSPFTSYLSIIFRRALLSLTRLSFEKQNHWMTSPH